MTTSTVYITDKTGKKFFNTLCSTAYAMSEVRNLNKKLDEAKQYPQIYKFLDIETAKVICDGECGDYLPKVDFNMSDEELLKSLGV